MLGIQRANTDMADICISRLLHLVAVCCKLFNEGQRPLGSITLSQHPKGGWKRILLVIHVNIGVVSNQFFRFIGVTGGILKTKSVCNKRLVQAAPFMFQGNARSGHYAAQNQLWHLSHQSNRRERTKRTGVNGEFFLHVEFFHHIGMCLEITVHQLGTTKIGGLGGMICGVVDHQDSIACIQIGFDHTHVLSCVSIPGTVG